MSDTAGADRVIPVPGLTLLRQRPAKLETRMRRRTVAIDGVWVGFLIGFVFLISGFLIGPRVPAEYQKLVCVGNVDLRGPFGFSLNCDSPEFMWLARDLSGLLAKNSPRQARPGLIIAAAILQAPISLVVPYGGPPQPIGQGTDDTAAIVVSFENNLPAYLAYIALNIGALLMSFFLVRRIMECWPDRPVFDSTGALVVLSTGFLVVANDVTKAFVWSPHTQMFNILVPILSLYVTLRLMEGALFNRPFILGLGVAIGLGITAYPFFAPVTACAIPPAIWAMIKQREDGARAATHLAALIVLSIFPSLLWYAYVRMTTGAFFQFEVAQGHVVWMAKAWAQGLGPFLAAWFGNLGELLGFAAPQAIPLAVTIVWLAFVALRFRLAFLRHDPRWRIVFAALYVGLAALGFYTCVGWIVDRLAYPAIPALIVAAGTAGLMLNSQLTNSQRRTLAAGFFVIALGQMVFVVLKNGPWS
ncbi:MAG: hypothetical protein ACR2K5_13995 [Pseudolabrys sp.]